MAHSTSDTWGNLKKISNPVILLLIYSACHFVISGLLLMTVFNGNESFEFAIKSIGWLLRAYMIVLVVSAFIFQEWTRKYWYISIGIFLLSLFITIKEIFG